MEKEKQKNSMLFCLEAIGCFLIVTIHCSNYPGIAGDVVNLAGHVPVLIFYLVSGFYLYDPSASLEAKKKRLRGKIRHIFVVVLLASLLYIGYFFVTRRLLEHASFKGMIMEYFNLRDMIMLLLFDRVTFAPHLWFVYALLSVYVVLYALACCKSRWAMFIVQSDIFPFVLAIAGMILRFLAFFSSWEISFFSVADVAFYRNWIFMGLPFVMMGQWLRKKTSRIMRWKDSVIAMAVMVGIVLMILEFRLYLYVFSTYPEVYVGTIFIVMGLFALAMKHPSWGKNTVLAKLGEYYTMPIYIIHLMIFWLLQLVFLSFGGDLKTPWYFWCRPLLVFVISIIVSVLYLRLRHKIVHVRMRT